MISMRWRKSYWFIFLLVSHDFDNTTRRWDDGWQRRLKKVVERQSGVLVCKEKVVWLTDLSQQEVDRTILDNLGQILTCFLPDWCYMRLLSYMPAKLLLQVQVAAYKRPPTFCTGQLAWLFQGRIGLDFLTVSVLKLGWNPDWSMSG